MQLKLFDEKTLDDMVNEGKNYMIKRYMEIHSISPKHANMRDYVDKLIMYDMATGKIDMPEVTIEMFDEYISFAKRINNNNPAKVLEYLQKDLVDKIEIRYSKDKVKELYPFLR